MYLLAHEMGHSYAFGADANTWQDWLNETHAEWSAMTYWYDADRVYFKERLDLLLDDKPLNLNPSQGKRPMMYTKQEVVYMHVFIKNMA